MCVCVHVHVYVCAYVCTPNRRYIVILAELEGAEWSNYWAMVCVMM